MTFPRLSYDRLCHVTRYITSILCAFIIFCGGRSYWVVSVARVGAKNKQSRRRVIASLLRLLLHQHPRSFFNVVCGGFSEYDALCMLTTQHSILHFTASLWNDMPQRKKFKFIGFIKTSSPLRGRVVWCRTLSLVSFYMQRREFCDLLTMKAGIFSMKRVSTLQRSVRKLLNDEFNFGSHFLQSLNEKSWILLWKSRINWVKVRSFRLVFLYLAITRNFIFQGTSTAAFILTSIISSF